MSLIDSQAKEKEKYREIRKERVKRLRGKIKLKDKMGDRDRRIEREKSKNYRVLGYIKINTDDGRF